MATRIHHVLFLCTGNSARSVLGEVLLNTLGADRFRAYSAGSHPAGQIHPMTLRCLRERGHPVDGLQSKGFDALCGPDAPNLDFVITVCDAARGESCPIWPGNPVGAHWGLPDPAAVVGSDGETSRAFERACDILECRVRGLLDLRLEALDDGERKRELQRIGAMMPPGLD